MEEQKTPRIVGLVRELLKYLADVVGARLSESSCQTRRVIVKKIVFRPASGNEVVSLAWTWSYKLYISDEVAKIAVL